MAFKADLKTAVIDESVVVRAADRPDSRLLQVYESLLDMLLAQLDSQRSGRLKKVIGRIFRHAEADDILQLPADFA